LGSKTATATSITYNVANLIADGTLPGTIDYTKLTTDDFVVGMTSSSSKSDLRANYSGYMQAGATVTKFNIQASYDAAKGVLTVTGTRATLTCFAAGISGTTGTAYLYATVRAWLVC